MVEQHSVKLTVGGPVRGTYLSRPADKKLFEACLAGEFAYVLACRQIGKSSLMNATAKLLIKKGIREARIDLNGIGQDIKEAEIWYFSLLDELADNLRLSTDVEVWWDSQPRLSSFTQRFRKFFDEVVLSQIKAPVVIFIDEIDVTLNLSFTDDFFAAIRTIHNDRAQYPAYERLTFVLLGVATPDELINDHKRTPFNIGRAIPMPDFTPDECKPLLPAIEDSHPGQSETYFKQIYEWTNGHPYLTQKLCAAVAKELPTDDPNLVDKLVGQLFLDDEERNDDNIQFVQIRVLRDPDAREMLQIYKAVLQDKSVQDNEKSLAINRLKLYGLVVAENGLEDRILKTRNKIYTDVFDLDWIKANTRVDRGLRIAVISVLISLIISSLFGFYVSQQGQLTDEELAQTYEEGFNSTTDTNLRLEKIAGLFDVPGFDDEARTLFNNLPTAEQIELFANATPDMEQQARTVIKGTYAYLISNTEDNNRLFVEMIHTLERMPETDDTLASEIRLWLNERQKFTNKEINEYSLDTFNHLIRLNTDNYAAYFDRALVLVELGEHEECLKDLELVLTQVESWQEKVQQALESDDQLYSTLIDEREEYPTLMRLVEIDCVALIQDGQTFYERNQYSDALPKFELALVCYEKTENDNKSKQGRTLHNIGRVHEAEKRYNEALDAYQQARILFQQEGDQSEVATILTDIGRLHEAQKRYDEALNTYEQVLAILREIRDQNKEAMALYNIGRVYDTQERYDDALIAFEQAANMYQAQGRYTELLQVYQPMLTIQRKLGNRASEGDILHKIGSVYRVQGLYGEALDFYQQALTIRREVKDRAGEGVTLSSIGRIYYLQGRYQDALEFYQQALTISREIGDRIGEGATLNNIGLIYASLGRYEQALDDYQQALTISREIGDRTEEGKSFNRIGSIYASQGDYEKALNYYQQALSIRREVGERAGEAESINHIGEIYATLGDYDQALDFYEQALDIWQEVGDHAGEGESINHIGEIYASQGRYEQALDYYNQALEIRRKVGERAGEGESINNIGLIYASLGRYDEALDFYLQALNIRQAIGEPVGEGESINNIGLIYATLGQYEQALDYYEQALSIRQQIDQRAGEGESIHNIAKIYASQGRYDEALEFYQRALEIRREVGDRAGEGQSINDIGGIYASLGRYDEALGFYEQALSIRQQIGDRAGEGESINNIGGIYASQGRYDRALEFYQQALDVIEDVRGEITVEEFKSSFTGEQVDLYNRIISLLAQIERPDEAFNYVQRAKARTFLDQLGNVRVNPLTSDNPQLIEEEQTRRDEIQALETQLREEWAKSQEQRNNEVIQSLTIQLEQKRNAYQQVLIRLKLENPEYASLVAVNTLSLTQTQQLLTDMTFLEYYVLPEQTLAFVVTSDSFHMEPISVTQESLYDEINRFNRQTLVTFERVPSSLQSLYDLLIAPIKDDLKSERIIIGPHNVLYYVPFAALHNGKEYFIEQHTLSQLPSASTLPFILENRKATIGPPLILGDADGSLPFARQEAERVASLYNTTAYVGDEALERLVWEQGPNAGIVHLSAHGAYNPISPLFSRVLLAPDAEGQYDGLLEVHEVYNLDLHNTDLVVLSSGSVSLPDYSKLREGIISPGDEIVGLNRAFIYAGTPSVMAALWDVDDRATRDLMVAFYSYLNEGYSKGEALREAQVDLIQNPDTAHPYFWAHFVLTGDMGEGQLVVASNRSWFWMGGVLLILVVVGGGGVWIWGRKR